MLKGGVASEDKFREFVKLLNQTPELSTDEKCEIFKKLSAGCRHCDPSVQEKVKGTALSCGLTVNSQGDFISKEISKKNSTCWDCVDRHSSGNGAYLYTFQFERYPHLTIPFEPIVPNERELRGYFNQRDPETALRENRSFCRFVNPVSMKELGYALEYRNGIAKLTLPDRETL